MAQRLDELRAKNPAAKLKHEWVPWSRISPNLKRAVIAAEDARFVEHAGLDFEAIAKAREKNERRGRVVAGGSTITQQLAKNLFLSPSKSYLRKAQEAVIALMLEAILPKQRILEIYLNVIEWGGGVFGAEAAARHYFKAAGRAALGRAGRATRRAHPLAAPLRAQSPLGLPRQPRRDHPRADALRGDSLTGTRYGTWYRTWYDAALTLSRRYQVVPGTGTTRPWPASPSAASSTRPTPSRRRRPTTPRSSPAAAGRRSPSATTSRGASTARTSRRRARSRPSPPAGTRWSAWPGARPRRRRR